MMKYDKKKQSFFEDKKGNMYVGVGMFLAVLALVGFLAVESSKVYDLQGYAKEEINRSCNIAIKEAMIDSYRSDGFSRINKDVVKTKFYDSLKRDMGLSSDMKKFDKNGEEMIQISIEKIYVDEENANMRVAGTIKTRHVFEFMNKEVTLPFEIRSKNMRLDNYI